MAGLEEGHTGRQVVHRSNGEAVDAGWARFTTIVFIGHVQSSIILTENILNYPYAPNYIVVDVKTKYQRFTAHPTQNDKSIIDIGKTRAEAKERAFQPLHPTQRSLWWRPTTRVHAPIATGSVALLLCTPARRRCMIVLSFC